MWRVKQTLNTEGITIKSNKKKLFRLKIIDKNSEMLEKNHPPKNSM